jgi:plasmid maintenance system antidote protein VapI
MMPRARKMAGKVIGFKPKKRGGEAPVKQQHIIRQRLDELGKNVRWLAGECEVSTATLYNFMNYKSDLKAIHFNRLLKVLGISLNYYYGVGKYAEQHRVNSTTPKTNLKNNG